MWRELVLQHDPSAICAPGASEDEIATAEQSLGVSFPADLRALLSEANGIVGKYGPHYIWSIATIVESNLEMRQNSWHQENDMPFDHLLFFANAGVDGILFAFPIRRHIITTPSPVYHWEPIEDNRIWAAISLEDYLIRWLDGDLSV